MCRNLHGSWNAIEYANLRDSKLSHKNCAPHIKTAEWICEENHPIVPDRVVPSENSGAAAAAAVNGIDRGVVRHPSVHRSSHLSNEPAV